MTKLCNLCHNYEKFRASLEPSWAMIISSLAWPTLAGKGGGSDQLRVPCSYSQKLIVPTSMHLASVA